MTKAPKRKKAQDLTTHEAIHRIFGKDAARELRKLLAREERLHAPRKPPRKKN